VVTPCISGVRQREWKVCASRGENLDGLREALDAKLRAEQAKDRAYWEPLKQEMEAFRRAERDTE